MCHSPDAVIGKQGTQQWWQSKVTEMLQEVTDVPDSDVDAIVTYLAKNFPDCQNQRKPGVGQRSGDGPGTDGQGIGSDCPVSRSQGQLQNAGRSEKSAGAGCRENRIEKGSPGLLMPTERFTVPSSDGVEISVQKAGSGPALLLIHGALLNGSLSWGAVLPKLAERYRFTRWTGADARHRARRTIFDSKTEADDIARCCGGH